MDITSLSSMSNGWFIGNFEPSLHKTDHFEVAIQHFAAGESADLHIHKIATEYTVVVVGTAKVNGNIVAQGSIITIYPGEETLFIAITDCITAVVKIPCVKGDKYSVGVF